MILPLAQGGGELHSAGTGATCGEVPSGPLRGTGEHPIAPTQPAVGLERPRASRQQRGEVAHVGGKIEAPVDLAVPREPEAPAGEDQALHGEARPLKAPLQFAGELAPLEPAL